MKKKLSYDLNRQLISIGILICGIIFIALGILLPRVLMPIYENNIYQYLKQPLELIDYEIGDNEIGSDVAYLYITDQKEVVYSDNFSKVINTEPEDILDEIVQDYGKFQYRGKTYYYNTSYNKFVTKISLTDDTYITEMRKDILYTIFPILLITLLIISGLLLLWSRKLVKKIEHLKQKVDNLSNDDYDDTYTYDEDDELKALSVAIDKMRDSLKKQENYKNQMYQNISHDFKTPLTVIKSYIEAIKDGIQTVPQGLKVIEEQVTKLELKVHSLLYLNKLNYFKERKDLNVKDVDVRKVIENSVEKMKNIRPDVKWTVYTPKTETIMKGTYDMWEAVVDNILSNFVRYAEKEIKVAIKGSKITFYNDGPKLDEKELENIFSPYKKGINGQFGLGLSIVRETLAFCGYEVTVRNEKKGVSFMIQ